MMCIKKYYLVNSSNFKEKFIAFVGNPNQTAVCIAYPFNKKFFESLLENKFKPQFLKKLKA